MSATRAGEMFCRTVGNDRRNCFPRRCPTGMMIPRGVDLQDLDAGSDRPGGFHDSASDSTGDSVRVGYGIALVRSDRGPIADSRAASGFKAFRHPVLLGEPIDTGVRQFQDMSETIHPLNAGIGERPGSRIDDPACRIRPTDHVCEHPHRAVFQGRDAEGHLPAIVIHIERLAMFKLVLGEFQHSGSASWSGPPHRTGFRDQ